MLDSVGIDYDDAIPREKMLEHLQAAGVEIITGAKVLEITNRGVTAERSGTSQGFEADNIILAVGMLPDQELNEQLVGKVKALYSVGDCANLGKIAGAVYSGARVASEL